MYREVGEMAASRRLLEGNKEQAGENGKKTVWRRNKKDSVGGEENRGESKEKRGMGLKEK